MERQATIQFARVLRKNPTDAERRLWRHLRRKGLNGLRFRRQAPIGPYIVDFYCEARSLVIEVDGGQHGASADAARDAWLVSHGYRVLRFWNNDLLKRGYMGTYHQMSEKHLPRYVSEFAGRHNDRPADTIDQMARMAHGMVGKRLRYQDLVA